MVMKISIFWDITPLFATYFYTGILFFDPEEGGDMFTRNFGWLSADYTALYPAS
jgi:hypothetical protein